MNGPTNHVCEAQPLEPELSVFGFAEKLTLRLATLSGILMLAIEVASVIDGRGSRTLAVGL